MMTAVWEGNVWSKTPTRTPVLFTSLVYLASKSWLNCIIGRSNNGGGSMEIAEQ